MFSFYHFLFIIICLLLQDCIFCSFGRIHFFFLILFWFSTVVHFFHLTLMLYLHGQSRIFLIQIETAHLFALQSLHFHVKEDLPGFASAILFIFFPGGLKLNFPSGGRGQIVQVCITKESGCRSWYWHPLKGNQVWALVSDSQDNTTCHCSAVLPASYSDTCSAEGMSAKSWCTEMICGYKVEKRH